MITDIEYKNAIEIINKYNSQKSNPKWNEGFIKWKNKYFVPKVKILEYQSVISDTMYTLNDLYKRYTKAMNETPFN